MSNEFCLKFRPFDKVERCFDIVASVDRALQTPTDECRRRQLYGSEQNNAVIVLSMIDVSNVITVFIMPVLQCFRGVAFDFVYILEWNSPITEKTTWTS